MKPRISQIVLAVAGATLFLMLVDMAVSGFHLAFPSWRVVLADLLAVSVLAYAAWASRARGVRLMAAIFLLQFLIRYVNTVDEGMFFLGLPTTFVIGALTMGVLSSAGVAWVLVWLMGKSSVTAPDASPAQGNLPSGPARSAGAWVWRLAAGDFSYVFLYFVAGMIVFPFVKDFYATMVLPAVGSVVLMGLFRGLVYIAAALPIVRMIPERRHAALALGLAYSFLGGVVPLLPDNSMMPGNIRFAHTIEIVVSNFIFGVVLAYLLTARPAPRSTGVTLPHAA